MYYPLQIPDKLNAQFSEYIRYTEHRCAELSDYCLCIWQMQSKTRAEKTVYNYILPDACIDIVVDFARKSVSFAGFGKATVPYALNDRIDFMGARLKPGAVYDIFGVNADTVMDNTIDLSTIDGGEMAGILSLTDNADRLCFFKNYLSDKMRKSGNKTCVSVVERLYGNLTERTVKSIEADLKLSGKQLYRAFKKWYGISPKVMLNVLRLHYCLHCIADGGMSLTDIAYYCGFYDQAHFIKEVKRYTGFSPSKLTELYE